MTVPVIDLLHAVHIDQEHRQFLSFSAAFLIIAFKETVVTAPVVQSGQHIGLVQDFQLVHRIRQLIPEEPVDQHSADADQPGFDMQLFQIFQFRIDNKVSEEVLQMMDRENEIRHIVIHHLLGKQLPFRETLTFYRFPVPDTADNFEVLFLQGIPVLVRFLLFPSVNQAQDCVPEAGIAQAAFFDFVIDFLQRFIHGSAEDHIRIGKHKIFQVGDRTDIFFTDQVLPGFIDGCATAGFPEAEHPRHSRDRIWRPALQHLLGHLHHGLAHSEKRLCGGGDGRIVVLGTKDVIISRHTHIAGHTITAFFKRLDDTDCRIIIHADDGIRQFFISFCSVIRKELFSDFLSAVRAKRAVIDPVLSARKSVPGERVFEDIDAFQAEGTDPLSCDMYKIPAFVHIDQVFYQFPERILLIIYDTVSSLLDRPHRNHRYGNRLFEDIDGFDK